MPEYPFHKGARTAMVVAGVLMCILCLTIPLGIWVIYRVLTGGVTLTNSGVEVKGLGLTSDSFEWADVSRIGFLKVPLVARGVGGMLARQRLDNLDYGLNLVVQLKSGKSIKFIVNQFERHADLAERLARAAPVKVEELTMGILGPKWPERA